jgi:hypothetical protein
MEDYDQKCINDGKIYCIVHMDCVDDNKILRSVHDDGVICNANCNVCVDCWRSIYTNGLTSCPCDQLPIGDWLTTTFRSIELNREYKRVLSRFAGSVTRTIDTFYTERGGDRLDISCNILTRNYINALNERTEALSVQVSEHQIVLERLERILHRFKTIISNHQNLDDYEEELTQLKEEIEGYMRLENNIARQIAIVKTDIRALADTYSKNQLPELFDSHGAVIHHWGNIMNGTFRDLSRFEDFQRL